MSAPPRLLDASGRAVSRGEVARARLSALTGGSSTPYDAASSTSAELEQWTPWLGSPDWETTPYRDRVVARIRDLVRNDGWASGTVTSILDSAIGGDLRLVAKPDHRALALHDKRFDAVWADEFGRAAEALWRGYAYDPARWCDAARRLTMPQLFRLAYRHKLIDGEALAVLPWLPERRGRGRAGYASAVQLVDPDRLSNPNAAFDNQTMRGGVEIDGYGAAVAYHIRRAHQGDFFAGSQAYVWDRVPRETAEGRAIVVHDFDMERTGQHRPAGGLFMPILSRMKMLAKFDQTELQAAVLNATFAAYIESPFDRDLVADSLGDELTTYQADRMGLYEQSRLSINGARMPVLYPGDKIHAVSATRPASGYDPFQHAFLRNVAAATGQTAEQVSKDWSKTNYSSARGALLEAWKTLRRRQQDFAAGFASPVYANWLEEAMDRGELPLPGGGGVPDFVEARFGYSSCRWMGPPRGWIDPVKEREGSILALDSGMTTLELETAEQGLDWEEVLDQRALELKRCRDLGIPLPAWANVTGQADGEGNAAQTIKPIKPA